MECQQGFGKATQPTLHLPLLGCVFLGVIFDPDWDAMGFLTSFHHQFGIRCLELFPINLN